MLLNINSVYLLPFSNVFPFATQGLHIFVMNNAKRKLPYKSMRNFYVFVVLYYHKMSCFLICVCNYRFQ